MLILYEHIVSDMKQASFSCIPRLIYKKKHFFKLNIVLEGTAYKNVFIALNEIVIFSSVRDIFCFANVLDLDIVGQNKGPDQDQNCLVL